MFHGLSQLWKHSGLSVIEWWYEHATEMKTCSFGFCCLIWNLHPTASDCDLLICEVPQASLWGSVSRCCSARCDLADERCAEYSLTLTISTMIIFPVVYNYVFHSSKYLQFLFILLLWRQSVRAWIFSLTSKKITSNVDHNKFLGINRVHFVALQAHRYKKTSQHFYLAYIC